LKHPGREQRSVNVVLPLSQWVVERQKTGLKIDRFGFGCPSVRRHPKAGEIHPNSLYHEWNRVLDMIAGHHRHAGHVRVDVDEVASLNSALEYFGATYEYSQPSREAKESGRAEPK
jgi:hypothetical protein